MSFYDDASLVVIPSAQKTSKLYAVKPTDGSGDLAFTRTGDTATRVNSANIIEKVRTNLVTRSQEFDNAAWTKDRTTVTANATTAPDGTATADKVVDTLQGNNAYRIYNGVTLSAISYSASFYVKAAEYSWVYIRIGNSLRVWFNVSTGVVGTNDFGITGVIQSAGNGWYRCTAIIATATAGGGFSLLGLTNANGVETYTPSTGGQGVFVWGAQLETTDFGATPYILTTSAAVSVGPVANVPRLDYLGSTCPRLLLEPQRVNLATFSEQFNNAAWTKSSATVTANTSVSPDGYTNADTLVITSGGYLLQQFAGYSAVSGQGVSISIFAKNQTNGFLAFGGATPAGTDVYRIENYGNGWYRHSVVRTFTVTTTGTVQYIILTVGTHIIWGAQVEAGAYATSYIPTLAASATRGADACSKTGISSLIGQTEGTLFAEFIVNGLGTSPTNILNSEKNLTAAFFMALKTNGNIVASLYVSGAETARLEAGTVNVRQRAKVAYAYKSGSSALYINGTLVASTSAAYTLPSSLDDLFINDTVNYFAAQENVSYNQVLLFKTRLTNAQLAELTTL